MTILILIIKWMQSPPYPIFFFCNFLIISLIFIEHFLCEMRFEKGEKSSGSNSWVLPSTPLELMVGERLLKCWLDQSHISGRS